MFAYSSIYFIIGARLDTGNDAYDDDIAHQINNMSESNRILLLIFLLSFTSPPVWLYWFWGNWFDTMELYYGDDIYNYYSQRILTIKKYYLEDINTNAFVIIIQIVMTMIFDQYAYATAFELPPLFSTCMYILSFIEFATGFYPYETWTCCMAGSDTTKAAIAIAATTATTATETGANDRVITRLDYDNVGCCMTCRQSKWKRPNLDTILLILAFVPMVLDLSFSTGELTGVDDDEVKADSSTQIAVYFFSYTFVALLYYLIWYSMCYCYGCCVNTREVLGYYMD